MTGVLATFNIAWYALPPLGQLVENVSQLTTCCSDMDVSVFVAMAREPSMEPTAAKAQQEPHAPV